MLTNQGHSIFLQKIIITNSSNLKTKYLRLNKITFVLEKNGSHVARLSRRDLNIIKDVHNLNYLSLVFLLQKSETTRRVYISSSLIYIQASEDDIARLPPSTCYFSNNNINSSFSLISLFFPIREILKRTSHIIYRLNHIHYGMKKLIKKRRESCRRPRQDENVVDILD